jgi:hypothetical protein
MYLCPQNYDECDMIIYEVKITASEGNSPLSLNSGSDEAKDVMGDAMTLDWVSILFILCN